MSPVPSGGAARADIAAENAELDDAELDDAELVDTELPAAEVDRVGWAYSVADDAARTEARFDAWAERYDADVSDLLDWRGPAAMAVVAERFVPREAWILDAGSGTGLVGEMLAPHGYTRIIGADISRRMLDLADEKDVYADLVKANLREPLPFADGRFEAVLSVGVSGYVDGEALYEFARVLRPGGRLLYTISDMRLGLGGFDAVEADLERTGRMEILEIGPEFAPIPKSDPELRARSRGLGRLG